MTWDHLLQLGLMAAFMPRPKYVSLVQTVYQCASKGAIKLQLGEQILELKTGSKQVIPFPIWENQALLAVPLEALDIPMI